MALSEESKELIREVTISIAKSAGTKLLVAGIKAGVKKLTVTNYEKKQLTGNKSITPTDDITSFDYCSTDRRITVS